MSADYLTREQAAERLKVSVTSIDRMVRDGRIAHVRVGRVVRIPEEAFAALTERALEESAHRVLLRQGRSVTWKGHTTAPPRLAPAAPAKGGRPCVATR